MSSDLPFDIIVNATKHQVELRLSIGGAGTAVLEMNEGGAYDLAMRLTKAADALHGLAPYDETQKSP